MSDDRNLQLAVLAELDWEPSITAAHIGVAANAGVITLTGQVESYLQKYAAEAAARREITSPGWFAPPRMRARARRP